MKKVWNVFTTVLLVAAIGAACFVAGNYIDISDVLGAFGMDIAPGEDEIISIVDQSTELLLPEYPYRASVRVAEANSTFKMGMQGDDEDLAFTYDGTVRAGYDMSRAAFKVDKVAEKIIVSMPELSVECTSVDPTSAVYAGSNAAEPQNDDSLLLKEMTAAAAADEAFQKMARVNAEGIIRALFAADRSTKKYEAEFIWA